MTDSTLLVLGASSLALVVVLYLWSALALAAMFRKVGEPVWKAWVPVVNVATVLKIGGFSPWLVLINLVPLFGFLAFVVVFIVAVHRITVGFGAGAGLTVVGAVVPVVWASILGFGSARWEGSSERGLDEDSAPVRRGRDFEGPYVPLIGGWTPEPGSDDRDAAAEPDARARVGAGRAALRRARGIAVRRRPVAERLGPADRSRARTPRRPPVDGTPRGVRGARPRRLGLGLRGARRPARQRSRDARRLARRRRGARQRPPGPPASAPAAPESRIPDAADAPSGWVPRPTDAAPEPEPAPEREPEHRPEPQPHPEDDGLATRALLLPGSPTRGVPSWAAPRPTEPAEPEPAASPRDDVPVSEEPPADDAVDEAPSPWAGPARRGVPPTDDLADAAPLTRPAAAAPMPAPRVARTPADEFPENSEAVSAVPEAPTRGPALARTSVSALYTRPEVPADDDFDALDRTVVARRKRIPWALIAPNGETVDLTSSVVILGRRPGHDSAYPDAQLVPVADETRTVSKTHARLELRGDTWYVTDLDSTNGVLFATLMGTEVEAPPGEEIEAGERFFLGDAEVRLTRRTV